MPLRMCACTMVGSSALPSASTDRPRMKLKTMSAAIAQWRKMLPLSQRGPDCASMAMATPCVDQRSRLRRPGPGRGRWLEYLIVLPSGIERAASSFRFGLRRAGRGSGRRSITPSSQGKRGDEGLFRSARLDRSVAALLATTGLGASQMSTRSVAKAARSWMKVKRASGLLPISRSTASAVSARSSVGDRAPAAACASSGPWWFP